MTLEERIDQDLVIAIKSGEEKRRDVLRTVKSNLKNYKIDQKAGADLTDEDVVTLLGKEIKRRKESIEAFNTANRPELAADEQAEIDIIQPYLPEQMSEDEIRAIVTTYFETNPKDATQIVGQEPSELATPGRDMGRIMGALSPQFKGKADMSVVAKILKEALQ